MISKCPNCKKEDTMCYDATWGVCGACGWRGNPSSFGYNWEEVEKQEAEEDERVKPGYVVKEDVTYVKYEDIPKPVVKRRKKEDRIIDVFNGAETASDE